MFKSYKRNQMHKHPDTPSDKALNLECRGNLIE